MPNFVQVEEFAAKTARDLERSSSNLEELATSLSQRVTSLLDRTAPLPRDAEFETKSSLRELLASPGSGSETFATAFPRRTMITGSSGHQVFQPSAAYYANDANLYRLDSDRFLYVTPTTSTEHLRVEDWNGDSRNISYAKTLRDEFSVGLPLMKMASGEMPKFPSLALEIGNDRGIKPLFWGQVHNRIITAEGSKFNTSNNFIAPQIDRHLASMPAGITFAKEDVENVIDKKVNTPMGKGWIRGIDDKTGEAMVRLITWPVTRTEIAGKLNRHESYSIWLDRDLAFRDLEGHIYAHGRRDAAFERIDGIGLFKPSEVTVQSKEGPKRLDTMLGVVGYNPVGARAAGGYLSEVGSLIKLQSLPG
jgi:hypothetical protein